MVDSADGQSRTYRWPAPGTAPTPSLARDIDAMGSQRRTPASRYFIKTGEEIRERLS